MPRADGGRLRPCRRPGLCLAAAAIAGAGRLLPRQAAWLLRQAPQLYAPHAEPGHTRLRASPGGARRTHGEVARNQMAQMPEAPANPLEWSAQEVKKANFMTSAAYAGSLCRALEAGEADAQYADRIGAMLGHADGARGFFVTYLTDPSLKSIADAPEGPPALISEALQAADADVVAPLAVMNLVMPTATAMAHEAKGDAEAAARSQLTARRASKVMEVLLSGGASGTAARAKLTAARAAAEEGAAAQEEEWSAFFGRWGYGPEQMVAIRKVLDEALVPKPA
mmetsp:Transcript_31481/g.90258  ORF Transcript_31481/g.90258 Transcript_31481/m.90258 type:complete len:282 (-) Transcript_31481:152-997(-)